jgi:hypothetical protein
MALERCSLSVMAGLVPGPAIHVVRLPANPGPLTPQMAVSPGRRFQFCIERNQSFGRLFLQRRALVILAARRPETHAVSRAPVYHILWVRGFRAPTISRPGFNLFKPLRRHFGATPFCRQPLARDPSDRNASVQKVDGGLRRDGGARPESI